MRPLRKLAASSGFGSGRAGRALALAVCACCLVVPATALAGGATASPQPPSHQAISGTRWMLVVGLGVLVPVAYLLGEMLLGQDERLSTSKTVAAVWTYLITGSFLGLVLAKFIGHPQGLDAIMHSGLAGQYGLLIGGPLGAAIAAKGIVTQQVAKGTVTKTPEGGASALQLIQNDDEQPDLGDFQYVLFNLVAMVYVVGTLFQTPLDGLPHIPDVLLGLTSVSAVGYVTKKALPSTDTVKKLPTAPADQAQSAD